MDELLSWLGSIAIIAGFFWIQVQVDQLKNGWAHGILMLMSVLGEAYVIWLWMSRNSGARMN